MNFPDSPITSGYHNLTARVGAQLGVPPKWNEDNLKKKRVKRELIIVKLFSFNDHSFLFLLKQPNTTTQLFYLIQQENSICLIRTNQQDHKLLPNVDLNSEPSETKNSQ